MSKHLKYKKNTDMRETNFSHSFKWKTITTVLSICVAFATTAALVLPAVTLNEPTCGLEAHTHSQEEGCYTTTMVNTLVCDYESLVVHEHTDDCYEIVEVNPDEVSETDIVVGESGDKLLKKVLICSMSAVEQHQHTDSCFVTQEENILTCELQEHTHNSDCFPLEQSENQERILEFVSDGYVTTIIASDAAYLPEGTVVTANPIYDSNEPAVAAFSLLEDESAEGDNSAYGDAIINKIDWGEVVRIKLFDISLTANGEEVQPKQPVEVKTQFTEPLYISEDEMVYGVHFGANGVEILPASIERNENGEITAITHTQSSFSTTGYVLVHISNAKDTGPNVLPVHYCIWANGQWVIVGSSRTGWYGSYDFREQWPPADDQRDCITVDQLYSVLADYGLILKEDNDDNLILSDENIRTLSKTIWYQRAEDDPTTHTNIRHDTTPEQKDVDGDGTLEWIFPLSANRVKDNGYHIYYVPGGTLSGKETDPSTTYENNKLLGADLKEASKFYSVEVRDMSGIVYDGSTPERQQNQIPAIQYIKNGSMTFVDVLPNGEMGWQWINSKGELVWTMAGKDDNTTGFYYEEAGGNGKETYGVLGIQERMTLIPYSLAVEGAQTNKEYMVDIMAHLDGEWQNVGHVSVLYQKADLCDGRWFVTAGQLYAYLKDFGFTVSGYSPDDLTNNYHKFAYAYGRASQLETGDMTMYVCDNNKAVSHNNNNNNTVAIGLGTEEDTNPKDYTIFYIPGSDNESFEDVNEHGAKAYADSEKIIGDRFYSIKVVDEYMLVYYGYETDSFLVHALEGQPTSVSVQNNLGVLWSVREPWETERPEQYVKTEFTTDYDASFNTFNFTAVNGPLLIEASSLNPNYYVQYFANIERYRLYGADDPKRPTNSVALIDTSTSSDGETRLPQNGTTPPLKYLGLTGTSSEYHVDTYIDNAEIYKQTKYVYDKAHYWENIDKLYDNNHYTIQEIRILKEGRDPLSTDDNDFWIYKVNNAHDNIKFTNRASEEYAPRDENQNFQSGEDYTILITEGMVMRLFYTLSESSSTDPNVAFYDYDISSDGSSRVRQGINSIHGSHTEDSYAGYAFGNRNTQSGIDNYHWNGNTLNVHNNSFATEPNGDGYSGCTFGLVSGINSDGTLQFSSGITAPTIFGGTKPTGRTDYTGSLTFHRKGDVYTLVASSVANGSAAELDRFFNPTSAGGTLYSHIYTNNFWALDGHKDGADKTGGGPNPPTSWLPESDDGQNHNSYFGMNFAIEFSLTSDYIGPTEYIFFGDDDMWVFLSSDTDGDGAYSEPELICDIGGVHSSVGEYVDLRDYIPLGSSGRYRLDFYYVERGASGSTCWMSYTLPSVTYTTVEEGTSEIVISKQLVNADRDEINSGERYEFSLELFTDGTKTTPINTPFSEEIHRADGTVEYRSFESGQKIHIAGGDSVRVLGLPIGTWYVITEALDDRFNVEANDKALTATAEGWVVEGTTAKEMKASFVNIHKGGPVLPNTGGPGKLPYIFSGWAMIAVASILIYKTKRKAGKRQDM